MTAVTIETVDALTPALAEQVGDLHGRAEAADGVAALSEDARLAIAGKVSSHRHLLAYADGTLAGYLSVSGGGSANDQATEPPAAELVVDPDRRRQGVGRALWESVSGATTARLWAHGNLPAARGFAAAMHLELTRELLKMARPLGPDDTDLTGTPLPDGFSARAFVPGADDDGVVATNAAAFAHHPEQGQMGLDGLHARMAEPWFDAAGLIVVEAAAEVRQDAAGPVAAFHWTKVDPGQVSSVDPTATAGEVYVVGVHPAYQGRGLARPLTALGLAHLAGLGLPEVVLYVDGDNAPAVQTYTRLGFRPIMVDVMYSPAVHPGMER